MVDTLANAIPADELDHDPLPKTAFPLLVSNSDTVPVSPTVLLPMPATVPVTV